MQPAPPQQFTVPAEIPRTFFEGIADPTLPRSQGPNARSEISGSVRAMVLYDAIIDDILSNPGTSMSDTAKRLGKAAGTVSLVVRSDFFKARWLQRRAQFNEELNFRLQTKLAKAAERSLDKTLEALDTRTNIPLPVLNEINKTLFDKLGYAPQGANPVSVLVQQNNAAVAAAPPMQAPASAEGLSKAREYLKILEAANAASGASPGNALRASSRDDSLREAGPVVEGVAHRVEP